MKDDFAYIRRFYDVPAREGKSIKYQGHAGEIVGANRNYLVIRLDERPLEDLIVHPTWQIDYQ